MIALTNGLVELEVSTDYGPRVMRYGYPGGENIFAEVPHLTTPTPQGLWKPRGGHRLWVAPEHMPGSYACDDDPVEAVVNDSLSGTFRQRVDTAGIEKQIALRLVPDTTEVVVDHSIVNRTCWPIRVAAWAITIVDAEGTAVIPQPPFRSHDEDLLPAQILVQWSFTDLTDPRWAIGPRLIRLTPDRARQTPQKIGAGNVRGWCALVRRDMVFLKRFAWEPDACYPDRGSNNELYTDGNYLEIETLGPLRLLDPGASATHTERWHLFRPVDVGTTEATLDAALRGLVEQVES
jgi:hypothetical protein